jgi:hypothetical protein
MNLDDAQSAHVVALRPGVAVAHTDGMDHPVLVVVDRGNHALEDPSAAVTTPPVGRRHAGCPDSCVAAPCTLRDIVHADHVPDRASVRLWAEITVLAHLVGQHVGTLEPGVRQRMGDPHMSCAIGTAVHDAVQRRHRYIRRWYDPDGLTRRVAGLLRGHVSSGADIGPPATRWRVAQFRWTDVQWALRDGKGDPQRPHQDTAKWVKDGLIVPGATQAEQHRSALAQMRRGRAPAAAVLGGEPMVIDDLTAELVGSGRPADRLTTALDMLGLHPDWPAIWLRTCWEDNNGT